MGRVGPHPLAGAHPAAHLVLAAVPRRVGDRPRLSSRRSTTRRCSASPSRSAASWPASPSRPSSSASSSASRWPPGSCCATRAGAPPAVARRGRHRRRHGSRSRSAPVLGVAVVANVLISGLAALLAPGIFASLSLAIPPKVRSLGFSMASLFVLPGLIVLYIVGGLADRYGIRRACSSWCRCSSSAPPSCRRPPSFVKADIAEGVDLHRGPGRGPPPAVAGRGEAAPRPQPRRGLRRRPGALQRRTSRSTRARSSPCSAPTAPGSPRS